MCHWGLRRRGENDQCRKNYLKSNGHRSTQFGERHKFLDSRSSAKPKEDKLKKQTEKKNKQKCARHIIIKLLRIKDREKNLDSS